jgi:hypothetical protein
MRADIHDGPEHNALQAEAEYIDARPQLPDRRKPLATRGRTIHWVKEHRLIGWTGPKYVSNRLKADVISYRLENGRPH